MGARRVAKEKSAFRQNAETVLTIYGIAIAAFVVLALGGDALIHFVNLTPYAGFPWTELRLGIALGIAIPTILFPFEGAFV